jgi:hypothetical protein
MQVQTSSLTVPLSLLPSCRPQVLPLTRPEELPAEVGAAVQLTGHKAQNQIQPPAARVVVRVQEVAQEVWHEHCKAHLHTSTTAATAVSLGTRECDCLPGCWLHNVPGRLAIWFVTWVHKSSQQQFGMNQASIAVILALKRGHNTAQHTAVMRNLDVLLTTSPAGGWTEARSHSHLLTTCAHNKD